MSFDPSTLLGGYTQAELEAAFALVSPKPNWKAPIRKLLPASTTAAEIARISYAVGFFTGAAPLVTETANGFAVVAPGYYASVGA